MAPDELGMRDDECGVRNVQDMYATSEACATCETYETCARRARRVQHALYVRNEQSVRDTWNVSTERVCAKHPGVPLREHTTFHGVLLCRSTIQSTMGEFVPMKEFHENSTCSCYYWKDKQRIFMK